MLVIVALTALSNWLQKRSQTQGGNSSGGGKNQPPPPRPPRRDVHPSEAPPPASEPTSGMDWEKELRRLFDGESSPAPPPSAPPPVIVQKPAPTSAPPPIFTPAPLAPPPLPRTTASDEGPSITLATLTTSEEAYRKARQLHEQTAIRLRQVTEQTKQHRPPPPGQRRRVVSPEIVSATSLIRDRRTVRQAIIASVIFAPPKAFEP